MTIIIFFAAVFLYYVFIGYIKTAKKITFTKTINGIPEAYYCDTVVEYKTKIEIQDFIFTCPESRLPFLKYTLNSLGYVLEDAKKTEKMKDLLFLKQKSLKFCDLIKQEFPKNNQTSENIKDMLNTLFISEAKRVMLAEINTVSLKSKYAVTKNGKLNPLSKFLENLKKHNFAYSNKALDDIEHAILLKQQRIIVEDLIAKCRTAEIKEKNAKNTLDNLIYFIEYEALEEIKDEYSWYIRKQCN